MRIKYPRTYHHPLSMAITADDKRHPSDEFLKGMHVLITEKRDGECTTMYNDHIHARSLDSKDHESRHIVKKLWSEIKHNIPNNMRVCGENLYAQHSIRYELLKSYFEVFNIWDGKTCLSWNDTLEYAELLGLQVVPTIYEGVYSANIIEELVADLNTTSSEGFVIRNVNSFQYDDFKHNVTKIVRKGHVQTDTHWMHREVVRNELEK